MQPNVIETIQTTLEEMFALLGVKGSFQVSQNEDTIEVTIDSEENGMLIGHHGETLEALQLIASLAVAKKLGEYVRFSLEIGEYKKQRMEYLVSLFDRMKAQALDTREGQALPHLKSWERRYVHMLAKDDPDVVTESEGEGRERVLVVYPR
jgi:spoIIIJ-associated protein